MLAILPTIHLATASEDAGCVLLKSHYQGGTCCEATGSVSTECAKLTNLVDDASSQGFYVPNIVKGPDMDCSKVVDVSSLLDWMFDDLEPTTTTFTPSAAFLSEAMIDASDSFYLPNSKNGSAWIKVGLAPNHILATFADYGHAGFGSLMYNERLEYGSWAIGTDSRMAWTRKSHKDDPFGHLPGWTYDFFHVFKDKSPVYDSNGAFDRFESTPGTSFGVSLHFGHVICIHYFVSEGTLVGGTPVYNWDATKTYVAFLITSKSGTNLITALGANHYMTGLITVDSPQNSITTSLTSGSITVAPGGTTKCGNGDILVGRIAKSDFVYERPKVEFAQSS